MLPMLLVELSDVVDVADNVKDSLAVLNFVLCCAPRAMAT